jgi:hypothetical protein
MMNVGIDKHAKMGAAGLVVLTLALWFVFNLSPIARKQTWVDAACSRFIPSVLCGLILPAEAQQEEMITQLQELYLTRLDEWATSSKDVKTVQSQVVENCGKLIMVASPTEASAYIESRRQDFDMYVDICTKMTVNRVHPQPEFSNPKIVKMICDDGLQWQKKLCKRSGLKQ